MKTIESTARPSPELRKDRLARYHRECEENRQHVAKTFKLNLGTCQQHHDWLKNLVQVNGKESSRAKQTAAEMYGCRQFVLGVIAGRCHMLPDKEQEQLKHSWEDQWDTAFGDLVGQVLGMQE